LPTVEEILVRVPPEVRGVFFHLQGVQIDSGTNSASCALLTWPFVLGEKRLEREANSLFVSSTEV
jgi:hypothetical protein